MRKLLVSSLSALAISALPLLAGAANTSNTYGVLNEGVGVGKTLSVGLNPLPIGHWFLGSNSNGSVADVTMTPASVPTSVVIKGLSAGSSTVQVCDSNGTGCMQINLYVSSVLGVYTPMASHPAGSWVLGPDGITVYYVTGNGVIPISTWDIFLNNGGKQSLIVKANQADMDMALLPLMDYNDSRVQ